MLNRARLPCRASRLTLLIASVFGISIAQAYTLYTDRDAWLAAIGERTVVTEDFDAIPDGTYAAGTLPSELFTNLELFPTNPLPTRIEGGKVVPIEFRDFSVQMQFERPVLAVGWEIISPVPGRGWTAFEYEFWERLFDFGSSAFRFYDILNNVEPKFFGWVADTGDEPLFLTGIFFDVLPRDQAWDNLQVVFAPQAVEIDIKPGSDPNCFNINGNGVIPVAILGGDVDALDLGMVDQSTLSFGGLEVRVRGNKGPLCELEDVNTDGYYDLVCHFQDVVSNWQPGNGEATLTGTLFDGTEIEGTDSICVVP